MNLSNKHFPILPQDLPIYSFFSRILEPVSDSSFRLVAVGDLGLSGRISRQGDAATFEPFLKEVRPLLRSSDIFFGNLETPLVDTTPDKSLFAASPQAIHILKQSELTLLNLANNHIYDYGSEGLRSTLSILSKTGIISLGAGMNYEQASQLETIQYQDTHIGWLACGRTLQTQELTGPHFWEFNEGELLTAVKAARDQVDILIVSIHLGLMYLDYPDPVHKALAENLVEAGANLILMHHAHVLQGIQIIEGKGIICYNLGNFLIDWQEGYVQTDVMVDRQKEGAIFAFDIDSQGIIQGTVLPTWMDENCHVHWATGERGLSIINRLKDISLALESDFSADFERQRIERNGGHAINVLVYHVKHRNWRFVFESLMAFRLRHLGLLCRWLINCLKPTTLISK